MQHPASLSHLAPATAGLGIAVIAAAIVFGPLWSPEGFSWIVHTTSEQAGQHMPGAAIMRAGFVAYGAGTLVAALIARRSRPAVKAALALFGLGLVATAIWSNAPILPGLPSDLHEDWLHSVASGVVGTAFAAACAARLFASGAPPRDALAWTGLAIAILIPLAMTRVPEIRGLLQKAMFAFSFAFVAREFGLAGHIRTIMGAKSGQKPAS